MPQSFAIGRGIEDSENLGEAADALALLLKLVQLMQRQNQILGAINISLGKMGPEFTDPDDLDLNAEET